MFHIKTQMIMKKYLAEMIGTMVLVLMGCGAAVFAGADQPFFTIGTLGVAFAFGLSVVAMAYTIGSISDCHIFWSVSFGKNEQQRCINVYAFSDYWSNNRIFYFVVSR
jgi:aquaporin Z